jgi:2-oxoisovalerate dehydrogenase E1 component
VRLAREEQRLVVFLEPIALYPMRDLHAEKDGMWLHVYPEPGETAPLGEVAVTGDGTDIAIVSFGNGFYLSCQAAARLKEQGVKCRLVDLRWLSPLPAQSLIAAIRECRSVLIVDETRRTGGVAEGLFALLHESVDIPYARVCAHDSFIATGPAYAATLPSAEAIYEAALQLAGKSQ